MTEEQEQVFEIIEQLYQSPEKMFMYLCKHFAKHYDIDLNLIICDNKKYSLMKNYIYEKKYVAFIKFDENNLICGPLYKTNVNGTVRTVFSVNNYDLCIDSYMYVTYLDDKRKVL